MLLREENDLKQSDEIQAKFYHGSYNLENMYCSHMFPHVCAVTKSFKIKKMRI